MQVLGSASAAAAVHVLTDALQDDPGFAHVVTRANARREAVATLYRMLVDDALRVATVLGTHDAGLAGVLVLYPPGTYPMSRSRKLRGLGTLWPLLVRNPADAQRLERFGTSIDDAFPATPTWYVAALGVRRDAQRAGHGRRLVTHALQLADRSGAPCYLETAAAANVAYYESLGFGLLSPRAPLRRGGPPEARMLRPPGPPRAGAAGSSPQA